MEQQKILFDVDESALTPKMQNVTRQIQQLRKSYRDLRETSRIASGAMSAGAAAQAGGGDFWQTAGTFAAYEASNMLFRQGLKFLPGIMARIPGVMAGSGLQGAGAILFSAAAAGGLGAAGLAVGVGSSLGTAYDWLSGSRELRSTGLNDLTDELLKTETGRAIGETVGGMMFGSSPTMTEDEANASTIAQNNEKQIKQMLSTIFRE
jgi:hypothetical protein